MPFASEAAASGPGLCFRPRARRSNLASSTANLRGRSVGKIIPDRPSWKPLTSNADCSKFVSIEHVHKNCTRLCLILSESFCGPQFPGINSPFQPFLVPTSHHLASFSRFLGLQRKAQVCLGHGLWHPGKCPTLKVSAF